jgi:hypothetical protein
MSFKNFLDLRKKTREHTQIIERVVFQRRSLKSDLFLALSVMLVASTIIWGISKADTLLNPQEVNTEPATSFSIIGSVTEVAETTISIDVNANKEVNGTTTTTDSFDTTNISSVQTNHFTNISLSDIKIGNNIILQGVKRGESIQIFKIFSYGNEVATGVLTEESNTLATTTEPIVATSTATSTDDTSTSTATTTLDASPSPELSMDSSIHENDNTTSTTSSSTPSIADVVKDVVGNIIDALDGTNSTSTDTTPSNQTPSDTTETPQTPTTDISEIFEGYTNPLGNLIPEETLPTTETPPAPEAPPAPTLDINQPTV